MTAADPRCAMLSELSQCAYRLGLAFGHEAERAEDAARRLEYFRLFDRCFFAVRVATALELRLWRTPATTSTPPPTPPRTDLRARLAGSGAAVALQLAPRPPMLTGGVPGGLAVRRATGPPRR